MENVIDLLRLRGFIDQITSDTLREGMEKPVKFYVGFDPTGDSLHLGNLVAIVAISWLQRYGHTPYALIGGATGRIGDPSGKSHERPFLEDNKIEENVEKIKLQLQGIVKKENGTALTIVNNADWFSRFSFIDVLRDIGKYFRIGPMLAKESVKIRLASEEGMSFTEFSYQLLQGYDFYHLAKQEGISLQMGGSDQWGNITAGIEYARKKGCHDLYGFTFPLLMSADGKKYGKSEKGAIWLDKDKLSYYEFYQYLIKVPDADVIYLMRLLTFMSMEEIAQCEKRMQDPGYEPNTAQKRLAEEVTRFVHGQEGLDIALEVTKGAAPGGKTELSRNVLERIAFDMPSAKLSLKDAVGKKYIQLLFELGLTSSLSEGRRLVKNQGAYLNNEKVIAEDKVIDEEDLIDKEFLLFGLGKKKKLLLRVKQEG